LGTIAIQEEGEHVEDRAEERENKSEMVPAQAEMRLRRFHCALLEVW
jgi:hypothetical protein